MREDPGFNLISQPYGRQLLACGLGPGSALEAYWASIHYRTALRAPKGKPLESSAIHNTSQANP